MLLMANSVRVEEVLHIIGSVEGNKIRLFIIILISPLLKPALFVNTLPQVKQPIDVAMMQPENRVECRYGDGHHVSKARRIFGATNEVLSNHTRPWLAHPKNGSQVR